MQEKLPEWMIEGNGVDYFLRKHGFPEDRIAVETAKYIKSIGGPDLMDAVEKLFPGATKIMLDVHELIEALDIESIDELNQILVDLELFEEIGQDQYELTEKGKEISVLEDYFVKWNVDKLKTLINSYS